MLAMTDYLAVIRATNPPNDKGSEYYCWPTMHHGIWGLCEDCQTCRCRQTAHDTPKVWRRPRPNMNRSGGSWSCLTAFQLAVVLNASAISVTVGSVPSAADVVHSVRQATTVGFTLANFVSSSL